MSRKKTLYPPLLSTVPEKNPIFFFWLPNEMEWPAGGRGSGTPLCNFLFRTPFWKRQNGAGKGVSVQDSLVLQKVERLRMRRLLMHFWWNNLQLLSEVQCCEMTNRFFRRRDLIFTPTTTGNHVRKGIQPYLDSVALRATQLFIFSSKKWSNRASQLQESKNASASRRISGTKGETLIAWDGLRFLEMGFP